MVIEGYVVLDSNILISFENDSLPDIIATAIESASQKKFLFISDITVVEVVVGQTQGQHAVESMEEVIAMAQSIEVTPDIIAIAKTYAAVCLP